MQKCMIIDILRAQRKALWPSGPGGEAGISHVLDNLRTTFPYKAELSTTTFFCEALIASVLQRVARIEEACALKLILCPTLPEGRLAFT